MNKITRVKIIGGGEYDGQRGYVVGETLHHFGCGVQYRIRLDSGVEIECTPDYFEWVLYPETKIRNLNNVL